MQTGDSGKVYALGTEAARRALEECGSLLRGALSNSTRDSDATLEDMTVAVRDALGRRRLLDEFSTAVGGYGVSNTSDSGTTEYLLPKAQNFKCTGGLMSTTCPDGQVPSVACMHADMLVHGKGRPMRTPHN